jgi:hypothetical protein
MHTTSGNITAQLPNVTHCTCASWQAPPSVSSFAIPLAPAQMTRLQVCTE